MIAREEINRSTTGKEHWAVIIGISHHLHQQLDLKYAARDAQVLLDALLDPVYGGYSPDRTLLLTDEVATTANIEHALQNFLRRPAREDSVLFYFAGQTALDPNRLGDVSPEQLSYLVVNGAWSAEQALTVAIQNPDPAVTSRTLVLLAPHLSTPLMEQALSGARSLTAPEWQVTALAGLIPHLPEETRELVVEEALLALRSLSTREEKLEALRTLAPHLSESQGTEVLLDPQILPSPRMIPIVSNAWADLLKSLPPAETDTAASKRARASQESGIYFVTYDTDPNNLATTLKLDALGNALTEIVAAEEVVLIVDSCHHPSLTAKKGSTKKGSTKKGSTKAESGMAAHLNSWLANLANSRKGLTVLASASVNESALEGSQWGGGHGVFTHYLVEGIRGGVHRRQHDGSVTIEELFEYVRRNVQGATQGKQNPWLAGDLDPLRLVLFARKRSISNRTHQRLATVLSTPLAMREGGSLGREAFLRDILSGAGVAADWLSLIDLSEPPNRVAESLALMLLGDGMTPLANQPGYTTLGAILAQLAQRRLIDPLDAQFVAALITGYKLIDLSAPGIRVPLMLRTLLATAILPRDAGAVERLVRRSEPSVDFVRWLEEGAERSQAVCQIIANSNDRRRLSAAGVLVGPDLVLTNYHVIAHLIESANKGGTPADTESMIFQFGDSSDEVGTTPASTQRYYLAQDWLGASGLAEGLDYALIRLDGTPGNDRVLGKPRGWLRPRMIPQALDEGESLFIVGPGLLEPNASNPEGLRPTLEAVSVVRLFTDRRLVTYHRAERLPGWSGAPCFTSAWDFVAMHRSHNSATREDEALTVEATLADLKAKVPEIVAGMLPKPDYVPGEWQSELVAVRAVSDIVQQALGLIAVAGLAGIPDDQRLGLYQEALVAGQALDHDARVTVLRQVLTALVQRKLAGAASLILPFLSDSDPSVRQVAAQALETIETNEGIVQFAVLERLSPSSEAALLWAVGLQRALGSDKVFSEYLLAGLYQKDEGPTRKLLNLFDDETMVRSKLEELVNQMTQTTVSMDSVQPVRRSDLNALRLSVNTYKVLATAADLAGAPFSGQEATGATPIRSRHLLGGLLAVPESVASQWISDIVGVDPETLYRMISTAPDELPPLEQIRQVSTRAASTHPEVINLNIAFSGSPSGYTVYAHAAGQNSGVWDLTDRQLLDAITLEQTLSTDSPLPPDTSTFVRALHALSAGNPNSADLDTVGNGLYRALPDPVSSLLQRMWVEVQGSNDGRILRIWLHFASGTPQAQALEALPWEYIKVGGEVFIGLDSRVRLIRRIAGDGPRDLTTQELLKVLVVAGDQARLPYVRDEINGIKEDLTSALGDRVQITLLEQGEFSSLQNELLQGYHVFHYAGMSGWDEVTHETVLLVAVGENEGESRVIGSQLESVLKQNNKLQLVFLNTNQTAGRIPGGTSSLVSRLVQSVGAVVGHQCMITDQSAATFAQAFYAALGRGLPLDACMSEGRRAVYFSSANWSTSWGSAVLYMSGSPQPLVSLVRSEEATTTIAGALSREQQRLLLDVLLQVPTFDTLEGRKRLLEGLPVDIVSNITRHESKTIDLSNILEAVLQADPLEEVASPLLVLLANALFHCKGTSVTHVLGNVYKQITLTTTPEVVDAFVEGNWTQVLALTEQFGLNPPPDIALLVKIARSEAASDTSIFVGDAGAIYSVAVAPKSNLVISGANNGTIKAWSLESRRLVRTYEGHTLPVYAVAVAPGGEQLASAGRDLAVRVWDIATGLTRMILTGHTAFVNSVAWSPDGKLIVSGGDDRSVRLWDVGNGEALATLVGHTDWVNAVAFSPYGRTLASASADQTVRIWDASTLQMLRVLVGHKGSVSSVCYSPDGQYLVSGSRDNTAIVWDGASGEMIAQLIDHRERVTAVAVTADGSRLITASDDGTIKVWDWETQERIQTFEGHTGPVYSVKTIENTVVSGGQDGTVRLWQLGEAADASGNTLSRAAALARITVTRAELLQLEADAWLLPSSPQLGLVSVTGHRLLNLMPLELAKQIQDSAPVPVGEAVSFQLSGMLAHTLILVPAYDGDSPPTLESIELAVRAGLAEVERLSSVRTLVIYNIDTSWGPGFPLEVAPHIVRTVVEHLERRGQLQRVTICCDTDEIVAAYEQAVRQLSEVAEEPKTPTVVPVPVRLYRVTLKAEPPAAGQEYAVWERVELNLNLEEVRDASEVADGSQVFLQVPGNARVLAVSVEAQGFQVEENASQDWIIRLGKDGTLLPEGERLSIELRPLIAGKHPIRIRIDQEKATVDIAPASLSVEISVKTTQSLPEVRELIDRRAIPAPWPDVVLNVVRLSDETGAERLSLYLTCPALGTHEPQPVGQLAYGEAEVLALRQTVFQMVEDLSATAPGNTLASLRVLGQTLHDRIWPPELQQKYEQIVGLSKRSSKRWTWLIISDEKAILPWEMVLPPDNMAHQVHGEFLAARFIVAHWVGGQGLSLQAEAPRAEPDLQRALTYYEEIGRLDRQQDISRWGRISASFVPEGGRGHELLLDPNRDFFGLHILNFSNAERVRAIARAERPGGGTTDATVSNSERAPLHQIQRRKLNFTARHPMIGLSLVNEGARQRRRSYAPADLELETGWIMPFLRAGASAVVGPRWATDPEVDQFFYSHFYLRLEDQPTPSLGHALWEARRAVRQKFPERADWLAYTYFGHPSCNPYIVERTDGFTFFEVLDPPDDDSYLAGAAYRFRVSFRRMAPAWYGGRVRVVSSDVPANDIRVQIVSFAREGAQTYELENVLGTGDYERELVLTMPDEPGDLPIIVRFQSKNQTLQTLTFNLDVVAPR